MEIPPLIPVSYLNAHVYCPRRFFLEHNRGMFEDNAHTVEGRSLHRVVDGGESAKAAKKGDVIHRRSVSMASASLGIAARLDLLEEKEGGPAYPVEYKKGKKPPKGREPWLNDRVQLCAQALLMGENGLAIPEKGFLYYISSRARVEVPITEELKSETRRIIAECRLISKSDVLPPLAENRNKCFGCSLNAICLPEEEDVAKGRKTNARNIMPMSLDGEILYADTPGAFMGLSGGTVKVSSPEGEELGTANLESLREVVLCGPVQASTQVIHSCLFHDIPVHYLSYSGRYVGTSAPMLHLNGILRREQWGAHFDADRSLELARSVVTAKVRNLRTLMLRYVREDRGEQDREKLDQLKGIFRKIQTAENIDSLRGLEGMSAKLYFSGFSRYIKPEKQDFFPFTERNRRPPRDPLNALLSFGYSLLAKDCAATAIRVGFDPFCGFYHTMKYGRPSLALDIMEFFRQPIVDSVVVGSVNNGVFKEGDFHQYQNTCYLNEKGRKKFLVQYEMRKKEMVTHPDFHYRLSYARTIELQYRLLGKYLMREMDTYGGFYIR